MTALADSLLRSSRTQRLLIELTSKCNLRCTYCAVAQPGYEGIQFPIEHFEALTKLIVDRAPEIVMINGHGETTIVKDWDVYVRHWLDLGLNLEIITNLSKKLKDTEIETLARLRRVTISTDSSVPELFEALRRNAKWEIFDSNLTRLMEAIARNEKETVLTFSCVVSDICAPKLEEFADYGLARGVRYFEFCNLAKYPDVEGAQPVRHLSELPRDERDQLAQSTRRMLEKLRAHGVQFAWPEALAQTLGMTVPTEAEVPQKHPKKTIREIVAARAVHTGEHAVDEPSTESSSTHSIDDGAAGAQRTHVETKVAIEPTDEVDAPLGVQGEVRTVYPSRKASSDVQAMTRRCLDPWSFAYLQADTAVRICCFMTETVGHLGTGESLDQILNAEKVVEIREGLLSGNPIEACRNCWARPWVPVSELEADVRAWTQV
ncbi:MAG: radical SAM protein [Planctomycetes bacterium]|nr:radical SAM protein [Planctomycetota bacterium]MCB9890387.1 radical SAM protein [Planctomycetota bacterium]MCB9917629.1 radical SAM protein [Planctomycetota bacterium]